MPPIIPRATEEKARQLLKNGVTIKRIAKQLGISERTVQTIKKAPRIRPRRCIPKLIKSKKPYKCPSCGGSVKYRPCLLCHPEVGYYDEPDVGEMNGTKERATFE